MKKLHNNILGSYLPAFLYIELDYSIDFNNFENHPDEVKGTFIHEYCHFIQDISTTYGYSSFLCYMQDFLYKIRKDKNSRDKKILDRNRDFNNLYYGDAEIKEDIFL